MKLGRTGKGIIAIAIGFLVHGFAIYTFGEAQKERGRKEGELVCLERLIKDFEDSNQMLEEMLEKKQK